MDKRFQVFVSSTYTDLVEERKEVIQALLELECMPAGMELFPAANDTQWDWIKKVIKESDYYIVIVGGRYGSIYHRTGLSYTEMEYKYAVESNIPVIGFLIQEPDLLPVKKTESDPSSKMKLDDFRALVRQRQCKFYSSAEDLGAKVSRSLILMKKQYPAIGWVRADVKVEGPDSREMLNLMRENRKLKEKLDQYSSLYDEGNLKVGNDLYDLEVLYSVWSKDNRAKKKLSERTILNPMSIDRIFSLVGPRLIESSNFHWSNPISDYLKETLKTELLKKHDGYNVQEIRISALCWQQVLVHLRALKLIKFENKKWMLTEVGDKYLTGVMTLKKEE